MSGFLKRNTTNTVNPAGGVNPASSPNVGQYGWTSYDAANVNQLIEYVNMAKEHANRAKESADYVQSKFTELQDFINYIETVYDQIKPIADNIELIYKDIVVKHQQVMNAEAQTAQAMLTAVSAASDSAQSATKSENEFVKSAAEAVKSANSAAAAKVSETSAANSAQSALDAAEELRKGNIYRGVWNIEAENRWPDPSGGTGEKTNSTWDVTLKEGSTEFEFAGEKWYWGDRIIYLKDEDKFQQIKSGSTVTSVNGKRGAVTLVPSDIGAAPSGHGVGEIQGSASLAWEATEDKTRDFNKLLTAGEYTVEGSWNNNPNNTGPDVSVGWTATAKVEVRKFASGPSYVQYVKWVTNGTYTTKTRTGTGTYPNIDWTPWVYFGPNEIESQYRMTIDRPGTGVYPYMTMHKRDVRTDTTSGYYTTGAFQYKMGNKTDVNNPDSGDIQGLHLMQRRYDNQANRMIFQLRQATDKSVTSSEVVLYEDTVHLRTLNKSALFNGVDFLIDGKKVYHEGKKPTLAELGAAASDSPRINGPMSIYAPSSHIRLIENDQNPEKQWHMEVSSGNFRLVETNVKSHIDAFAGGAVVIGSPTAVKSTLQVGPSATGSNLGNNNIRNQMTSLIEVISPADPEHKAGSGIVFHNASSGTSGLVYKQEGAGSAYFNFISDETNWDVRVNGNSVYHQGFKPTPIEIGALPAANTNRGYEVPSSVYTQTGVVVENVDKTNWLSIEAPEADAPYLAVKRIGDSSTSKSLVFGGAETYSNQRLASWSMRVSDNAGLKFSAHENLAGISWGIGIDNSTGTLGVHRYQNGVWVGCPMEFTANGDTNLNSNLYGNGSIISNGGYLSAVRSANPMVELHSPGTAAGMMYLPGNGRLRFASSNGAGGEVNWYADMQATTTLFPRRIEPTTNSTHWGSRDDNVGGLMDRTANRYVSVGEWHPMITSSTYIHNSQGYATTWSLGHFRHADYHNGQVVLSMVGDGLLRNSQRFYFDSNGTFGVAGTHNNHWWSLSDGGYLSGNIFGGYGHMVNWCTGSFAPASDAKLKTILGESTKSALDIVNQFSFKKFAWNEEAGEVYTTRSKKVTEIGLIAQEVEAIDPCLVKDIKIEGTNSTELKSLDTASMLALALKAIQEQQVQIDELKEKLNEFILK